MKGPFQMTTEKQLKTHLSQRELVEIARYHFGQVLRAEICHLRKFHSTGEMLERNHSTHVSLALAEAASPDRLNEEVVADVLAQLDLYVEPDSAAFEDVGIALLLAHKKALEVASEAAGRWLRLDPEHAHGLGVGDTDHPLAVPEA